VKRSFILSIAAIFMLTIVTLPAGCEKQAGTTTTPATTAIPSATALASTLYTNSEDGFSLSYPAGWGIQEDYFGAIVYFAGPTIEKIQWPINMIISKVNLLDAPITIATLEDFVSYIDKELPQALENYKQVEEKSSTAARLPAITFTYTYSNKNNSFKGTQINFKKGTNIFCITFTATSDTYDENVKYFDLVVNSFKFK
jgi:hypothetical protein